MCELSRVYLCVFVCTRLRVCVRYNTHMSTLYFASISVRVCVVHVLVMCAHVCAGVNDCEHSKVLSHFGAAVDKRHPMSLLRWWRHRTAFSDMFDGHRTAHTHTDSMQE